MKAALGWLGAGICLVGGGLYARQTCPPSLGPAMPVLAPLPGTGPLRPASGAHFRFIATGDNRPRNAACALSLAPTTALIFAGAAKSQANFVLWLGDTVYGKSSDPADADQLRREYDQFLAVAKGNGLPVFNTPGNHELNDGDTGGTCAAARAYSTNLGELHGSFDYANSHFVSVDTEEPLPESADCLYETPAMKPTPGYISDAQLQALESDLASHRGAAHVFLFMHHPPTGTDTDHLLCKSSAQRLMALATRFPNVHYVLAAHLHDYVNIGNHQPDWSPASAEQGPIYLVDGQAGAPPANGKMEFSYLLFDVDGDSVTVSRTLVPTPPEQTDCWPPLKGQ